jgi:hypothetical protein
MSGLIHVVMFLGALAAFAAWSVAAFAVYNVVSLASKADRLSTSFDLGLWNFAGLEARFGTAVTPHLVRYKRGLVVLLATLCAMLALSLSSLFLRSA